CCYYYPKSIDNKKPNIDKIHITIIMALEQVLIQYYSNQQTNQGQNQEQTEDKPDLPEQDKNVEMDNP
ncbi:33148_t:CDS:1, partial [Racocetra persica]